LRACDYYQEFEKGKIILPDIALKMEATLDRQSHYVANTGYIIPVESKFLLHLLNSKLVHFFYTNTTSSIRGGYLRFIRQYLEEIPVVDHENVILLNGVVELSDTDIYELYGLDSSEVNLIEGYE
jgi:hypothetical protein